MPQPEPIPPPRGALARRALRLGAFVGLLTLAAAVVVLPSWLVSFDLESGRLTGPERVKAVNDVRTLLLQTLAGASVTLGVIATWRRLRLNEEELRVSRDGQMTERYSRAVEHLGSENLDVRLGGIHALVRVAQNSPVDRSAVQSVLSAYVRGHSPWPPTRPGQTPADAPLDDLQSLAIRASDIQEAMTSLAWLQHLGLIDTLAVPRIDLRYGRFDTLTLDGINLGFAHLGRARFHRAHLRGANLFGADLTGADLTDTDLTGANLTSAVLTGALLTGTVLRNADLRGARFDRTNLRDVDLQGADLTGAHADINTTWPTGLDPTAAGVLTT